MCIQSACLGMFTFLNMCVSSCSVLTFWHHLFPASPISDAAAVPPSWSRRAHPSPFDAAYRRRGMACQDYPGRPSPLSIALVRAMIRRLFGCDLGRVFYLIRPDDQDTRFGGFVCCDFARGGCGNDPMPHVGLLVSICLLPH